MLGGADRSAGPGREIRGVYEEGAIKDAIAAGEAMDGGKKWSRGGKGKKGPGIALLQQPKPRAGTATTMVETVAKGREPVEGALKEKK